jgi:hypothetical protein
MSNDFDLGDFGDFDQPSLPDADADFSPAGNTPSQGQPRNNTFLIVAIALVIIFLLGLGLIAFFVVKTSGDDANNRATAAAIQLTNDVIGTDIAGTATAKSYSPTPTPTSTFTETPSPTASDTPTPTIEVTAVPTIDETAAALALTQSFQLTSDALTLAATTGQTPVPATPTPTVEVTTEITVTVGPSLTPSSTPKAVPTGLPKGGFFDDLAGGRAQPTSLALFGALALVLVGVIFAARRLRVNPK